MESTVNETRSLTQKYKTHYSVAIPSSSKGLELIWYEQLSFAKKELYLRVACLN